MTTPNHNTRATLARIIPPSPDWYDLHRDSTFVFITPEGIEEHVGALFVPSNCRTVGQTVKLEYVFFGSGSVEGYHYEPRAVITEEVAE